MGLISLILMAILGVLGAAFSRQLTDEFKAWTPWLVDRLIRRAVRNLPDSCRERLDEEWRSHVNEIPGQIGQLIVAFGFLTAARKIRGDTPILFGFTERLIAAAGLLVCA